MWTEAGVEILMVLFWGTEESLEKPHRNSRVRCPASKLRPPEYEV